MVRPTPHPLPEQRERLEQIVDAIRLRMALYPSQKPPSVQRRSRSRQLCGSPTWCARGARETSPGAPASGAGVRPGPPLAPAVTGLQTAPSGRTTSTSQ